MDAKKYFFIGCKLFGVYCFVISIPTFISFIQLMMTPINLPPEILKNIFVTNVLTCVIPVCYMVFGVYLLRDGSHLFSFAKLKQANLDDTKDKKTFHLFLKFLGMYLIISFFPDFMRTISNLYTYYNAPKYLEMFQEKKFIYYNFLPSIAGMSLGVYLLRSGRFFLDFAYSNSKSVAHKENK